LNFSGIFRDAGGDGGHTSRLDPGTDSGTTEWSCSFVRHADRLRRRYQQIIKYYSVATLRLALHALLGKRQVRVPAVDRYQPHAVRLLPENGEVLAIFPDWLRHPRCQYGGREGAPHVRQIAAANDVVD